MTVHVAYRDAVLTIEGTDVRRRPASDAECVAVAGGRVLVGTREGVARLDGGPVDGPTDPVTALAVGPDGTAWCGTEPSAVYRSTDGGATWTRREGLTDLPSASEWSFPPRPDTHHVRWIEPHPRDPDRLYVAIEAGALVRTTDGGATWRDRTADGPRDTHGMAIHPDRPAEAWAAAGDGCFHTADGGDAWTRREAGLDGRYCWSVALDPADPDRALLSSAAGPRTAHDPPGETVVYRRTDAGAPAEDGAWERVDGPPTGEGTTRAVLAAGESAAYAASNAGVFRTSDWGETWTRVADAPGDATTCRGVAVEN